MNFECKQLSIDNDPDFVCTIEFSDILEEFDENKTYEVKNYKGCN